MTSLLPTSEEARIERRRHAREQLVRDVRDMAMEREQGSIAERQRDGGHHEVAEAMWRDAITLRRAADTIEAETPKELH